VGQGLAGQKFAVVDVTPVQADGFPWVKIDFNNSMAFVRFDLVALEGDCANFVHDDRLTAPVAANISQGFHSQHRAVDFPVPVGTPLINRLAGVVVRSMACPNCQGTPSHIFSNDPAVRDSIFNDPNWGFGFGEHLIIRHNFTDIPPSSQQQFFREGAKESDFIFVLYAHLSRRDVQLNQTLRSGDSLGLTGHTGYSTAPHLHMEVAYGQDWGRSQKVHPATLFNIQRA
jgi:murein DD-endopeptidase MepM/ murein hydrolase activator NlpD